MSNMNPTLIPTQYTRTEAELKHQAAYERAESRRFWVALLEALGAKPTNAAPTRPVEPPATPPTPPDPHRFGKAFYATPRTRGGSVDARAEKSPYRDLKRT